MNRRVAYVIRPLTLTEMVQEQRQPTSNFVHLTENGKRDIDKPVSAVNPLSLSLDGMTCAQLTRLYAPRQWCGNPPRTAADRRTLIWLLRSNVIPTCSALERSTSFSVSILSFKSFDHGNKAEGSSRLRAWSVGCKPSVTSEFGSNHHHDSIGSFYAFILNRNENVRLTVVARSNYDAVQTNGIQINSENHGQHAFRPFRGELSEASLLKARSLTEVL